MQTVLGSPKTDRESEDWILYTKRPSPLYWECEEVIKIRLHLEEVETREAKVYRKMLWE